MRGGLLGCGTLCLAGLAVAGVLFGYLTHKGLGLDSEAKAYADASLTAITAHWDVAALASRASPELLDATPEITLEAMFANLQTLGTLIGNQGCTGQAGISKVLGQAAVTSARYTCNAVYQGGPARIEMNLIKRGAAWQITGFHVNSDALLHPTPSVRL